MFASAFAYLESKTPTWIKIIIALIVVGWMAPLEVRDWFSRTVRQEVHAVIGPMETARDNQIGDINTRIDTLNDKADETNSFVKAMALEQLGAKRYQQIKLTTVDKK